jgi:hypothetical protein
VNAGRDAVEEVCAVSRDPEMSDEGNPKESKFRENQYALLLHSNPVFATDWRDIRRRSESSSSKHGTLKAVNFVLYGD